ncbi:MAG: hypothetical protein CSA65_00495 [Proteobacteria bacterium]|nr:MAG: hypothetical protein CSB49_00055 [Pseudomonadota bacterium]PIE19955.1 MAG: hypothetical protein CSA65_00495 [Pseudomonadota bacterium]
MARNATTSAFRPAPALPAAPDEQRTRPVAASEHDLLTLARALVGQLDPDAVVPLLRRRRVMPAGIGPTCAALLCQLLGRGSVIALARKGAWRAQDSLVEGGEEVARGRLWQKRPAPALRFGPATMRLLRHLAGEPQGKKAKGFSLPKKTTLELGDELMLYLACELLRRAGYGEVLSSWPAVRNSALCWLGHVDLLVGAGEKKRPSEAALAAFHPRWVEGAGATILEALGPELARRWLTVERGKGRIVQAQPLAALGEAQDALLCALSDAADRAGRRDLLGFVLEAGAALLGPRPTARLFIAGLTQAAQSGAHLAERQAAARGAGALLRGLSAFAVWIEEARQVRFFDDDYESAQLLLARWAPYGNDRHEHAEMLLRELGSLQTLARDDEAAGTSTE